MSQRSQHRDSWLNYHLFHLYHCESCCEQQQGIINRDKNVRYCCEKCRVVLSYVPSSFCVSTNAIIPSSGRSFCIFFVRLSGMTDSASVAAQFHCLLLPVSRYCCQVCDLPVAQHARKQTRRMGMPLLYQTDQEASSAFDNIWNLNERNSKCHINNFLKKNFRVRLCALCLVPWV